MEEHFNENYAESDKYPKATFKGSIKDFNGSSLDGKSTLVLTGEMTFHGKKEKFDRIPIEFKKDGDNIKMTGHFNTKASHFNIYIPKIVSEKIAEDIQVSFIFNLNVK